MIPSARAPRRFTGDYRQIRLLAPRFVAVITIAIVLGACSSGAVPGVSGGVTVPAATSSVTPGAVTHAAVTPGPSLTAVRRSAGSWTLAGETISPQTATLLADGRVLVVGGADGRSAAVYDPTNHTWTTTGEMAARRSGHTATLLPSGQVLLASGVDPNTGQPLPAELYDPARGTWAPTGSMVATPSLGSTATLLPNGRVLVAGGDDYDTGTPSAAAELYDPASRKWTTTGDMVVPRSGHTATLLPDGRVLVVGGGNPGAGTWAASEPSAELYDPASGIWTATRDMIATPSWGSTATLLADGRVLVAGGDPSPAGGCCVQPQSAELYDPATGIWTATGRMITPRLYHGATLLSNGLVLVTGGTATQLYDPATGIWTASAMAPLSGGGTATLLRDGRVLVTVAVSWCDTIHARVNFKIVRAEGGDLGPRCGEWHSIGRAELYDPGSVE